MLVLILVSVRLSFKATHNYMAMCHDHEIYHKAILYKFEVGVCLDMGLQV
jgi:hypothetical protein